MSIEEETERVIRTFFDAVSNKDYDKVRERIHENYVARRKSLQGMKKAVSMANYPSDHIIESGPEPLIERIKMLFDGLDDFKIEIVRLIVNHEDVWVNVRVSGCHKGVIFGIPPSGRWIEYLGFLTYKIQDGKIIENDVLFNWFALLNQLGVFAELNEVTDLEEYLNSIRKFQKLIGVDDLDTS